MKKTCVFAILLMFFVLSCGSKDEKETTPENDIKDSENKVNPQVETVKTKGDPVANNSKKVPQVKFETKPALKIVTIRFRTSMKTIKADLGDKFGQLGKYLGKLGIPVKMPAIACYYNEDKSNLDTSVTFAINQKVSGSGNIKYQEIPPISGVSTMHFGSYGKIEAAYTRILKFMAAKGYKPVGIFCELYHNDPTKTPEADLKTEVFMPTK
jgi:effector-binding domain-containing protein